MTIKIAAACSFRESDACIVASMRARALPPPRAKDEWRFAVGLLLACAKLLPLPFSAAAIAISPRPFSPAAVSQIGALVP